MGGDPIPSQLDFLRDRFLADQPRRKWKVTRCLACEKKIKYFPMSQYNGTIKCPHCGTRFLVPSLDKYVGVKVK